MRTYLDLMQHVDVGVSCSSLEGLPVTLLEYMANRVPVVCSEIPAHHQILAHEKTGLLFTVGDYPEMVRELHRILNNGALREQIIEQAEQSVASRRWETAAQKTLQVYRRLLTG